MGPREIDVERCRPEVEAVIARFGPPGCDLLVVDSVQDWVRSVGIADTDPFRAAMAVTRNANGAPAVVLLSRITLDIQQSIIPALQLRGFDSEVARLQEPGPFLEHLVLHEIAHLLLEGASETECDRWAFERLSTKDLSSG